MSDEVPSLGWLGTGPAPAAPLAAAVAGSGEYSPV